MILLTFLTYSSAVRNGFVWDDDSYLTHNRLLTEPNGLRKIWTSAQSPQYYPMVFTSFWLEKRLWGLNPAGYHIVNIVLHALNAVLVWLLFRSLEVKGALLIAAIFAAHPVQVESVAWIAERKNVLSAFFFLLSVLCYLKFEKNIPLLCKEGLGEVETDGTIFISTPPSLPLQRGGTYYFSYIYISSLLLFACALLSKSVTATLPAVLLILRWMRGAHSMPINRRAILSLIPFFFLAGAMGLVTILYERHVVMLSEPIYDLSFYQHLMLIGKIFWFYIFKLLWPANLIFIYPRWELNPAKLIEWIPFFGFLAALCVLWLLRKKIGREPFAAMACFVALLFPALGLFKIYPMRFSFVADHFQYLASIGFIGFFVGCVIWLFKLSSLKTSTPPNLPLQSFRQSLFLRKVKKEGQRGGTVLVFIVVAGLAMLSWKRAFAYKSAETLWQDTIEKNPRARIAYSNLGTIYYEEKKYDKALPLLHKAVELDPNYAKVYFNLGSTYYEMQMYDKALPLFEKTIELVPNYAKAYFNMALIYSEQKKYDKALLFFQKTVSLDPKDAEAYNNMGAIYFQQKNYKKALEQFENGLKLSPENKFIQHNVEYLRGLIRG